MILVDESEPVGEIEPPFESRDVQLRRGLNVRDFYELEEEIGRGKFGTVFKCREKSTGLRLAAKFVQAPKKADRINVERELEIMKSLRNPRLIQVYDAYDDGKKEICLLLELIEGGELFERVIDDDFILTERACAIFMRQICEGIQFIHLQKVIHLDMKPENILCLTRTGNRIKLIDFGLARRYDPSKKLQVLFGTPEFVAPEVVNFDVIGFGTDMWSVGIICYVLLSGLSPFMGESDVETMANVTIAKYDFDDEAFSDVSVEAKDFISKLLIKQISKRMTATECLRHPWLRPRPPLPTPPPPPAPKAASISPSLSSTVSSSPPPSPPPVVPLTTEAVDLLPVASLPASFEQLLPTVQDQKTQQPSAPAVEPVQPTETATDCVTASSDANTATAVDPPAVLPQSLGKAALCLTKPAVSAIVGAVSDGGAVPTINTVQVPEPVRPPAQENGPVQPVANAIHLPAQARAPVAVKESLQPPNKKPSVQVPGVVQAPPNKPARPREAAPGKFEAPQLKSVRPIREATATSNKIEAPTLKPVRSLSPRPTGGSKESSGSASPTATPGKFDAPFLKPVRLIRENSKIIEMTPRKRSISPRMEDLSENNNNDKGTVPAALKPTERLHQPTGEKGAPSPTSPQPSQVESEEILQLTKVNLRQFVERWSSQQNSPYQIFSENSSSYSVPTQHQQTVESRTLITISLPGQNNVEQVIERSIETTVSDASAKLSDTNCNSTRGSNGADDVSVNNNKVDAVIEQTSALLKSVTEKLIRQIETGTAVRDRTGARAWERSGSGIGTPKRAAAGSVPFTPAASIDQSDPPPAAEVLADVSIDDWEVHQPVVARTFGFTKRHKMINTITTTTTVMTPELTTKIPTDTPLQF